MLLWGSGPGQLWPGRLLAVCVSGIQEGRAPPVVLTMARWPRRVWTTIFTYGTIFILFPLLCLLAYAYVNGWIQ